MEVKGRGKEGGRAGGRVAISGTPALVMRHEATPVFFFSFLLVVL